MSKFGTVGSGSTYFKRNNVQQLTIKNKVSQKELKEQKKNKKSNLTDNEFNKLMEENENENTKQDIHLSSYLNKIVESEYLTKLIEEGIKENELITKIKFENITGSQLLKAILNKYNDPNNLNWVNADEYVKPLKCLLDNNLSEQLLCLLVIQDFCVRLSVSKIIYKNKEVYWIKLIFQLLFTQDIIEESVYWEWQELLNLFVDVNIDVKNKLCIQTAEFYNILKITFTDQDYEEENDINGVKETINPNYNNSINNDEKELENVIDSEQDDKYKVPEEQDYNMDENFDLDDL